MESIMADRNRLADQLRIILDIPSLKSKESQLIQSYGNNELFEFIAIGEPSEFTQLQTNFAEQVVWITKGYHQGRPLTEEYRFPYTEEVLAKLAAKQDLKLDEVKLFQVTKILSVHADHNQKVMMVTERKKLINYQKYYYERLPEFTIFDPEEASLFIDLFCKRHGKYFVQPNFSVNRGLWYFYSMRSKLKQFQLAWSVNAYSKNSSDYGADMQMMGSISNRMKDMLKAIDEIGINYYKGSNNDTMDDMLYHFNYWITLYSGILDALAWVSLYRYGITIENKNKVALGNEDVLAEIYKANPKLKEVISENRKVIGLVYEPRNIFIHREMLHGLRLNDYQASFELNMIDVEGEFLSHIRALQPVLERGLNKAGLYKINGHGRYLLEPYRFVRFATRVFVDFLNQYVSALEYEQLLVGNQDLKEKVEEAAKTIIQTLGYDTTKFQDDALGY